MHKAIPRTTAISPTIGESEIAGSEANQPHLKFVVKYREAAWATARFPLAYPGASRLTLRENHVVTVMGKVFYDIE
jgi:hypothetical protein